jgi:biopolymer transport protein ExbD
MNLSGTSRVEEPEISLTSLIDVVFTLIIFFVVTTTFEDRSAVEVALPEASAEPVPQQQDPLLVVINREGRYFVGANEVLKRDPDSLKEAIARIAGDDRERAVVIRADAQAEHQSVITAMDVLGQLGFQRLQLATTPSAPPAGAGEE